MRAQGRLRRRQPQRGRWDDEALRAPRFRRRRGEGRHGHDEGGAVKGLELSRRFYTEAVRPILESTFPHLEYAAALIGSGSEVLELDDEMSRDHDWGPRVFVFTDDASVVSEIDEALARELPATFGGFRTEGVRVSELGAYLRERLAVDPRDGFGVADWLRTPTQRLLEVTSGGVFHDPRGELARVREDLAWYPHDVWLYAMAGHWQRIAEYEHFVGRTGLRDDELGSHLIAASIVRDVMRLGFLQVRRYAPYAKWLGTSYASLGLPEAHALRRIAAADDWRAREDALVTAYASLAARHNELDLTDAVDPEVRQFWDRPFRVLFAGRFASALRAAITNGDLRALSHPVGAIDALSDNTAFLERPDLWWQVRLYDRA